MNEQDQSMKPKNLPWPKQPARSGTVGLLRTACALRLLLLLLLTLPAVVQAQFRYTTNNGTITITGYAGPGGAVVIPDTINGLPVTRVGDYAFYIKSNLANDTIPSSVISIGNRAFAYCTSLTAINVDADSPTFVSVDGVLFDKSQTMLIQCPGGKTGNYTIPSSVTSIGDHAFFGCTSLVGVTISNSVTSIGLAAFYRCASLMSVTIPNSVASIGSLAFYSCTSLTSATIGSGVTSIGGGAFQGCISLASVTIPNSVASIGGLVFEGCTSLAAITVDTDNPTYVSVDGVLFDKSQSTLMQCPGGKNESYAIPNSVTNIGEYAFSGCANLTSVTIPSSVTSIGSLMFRGCTSLTTIAVDEDNSTFGSVDGVLCNKWRTKLIQWPWGKSETYTIPNSITNIGSAAFAGCARLASVTIPGTVTTIGIDAFYGCSGLTSVAIPNSITVIGDSTFVGCASLTSVTIGSGVTRIGFSAFSGCTSLKGVYFRGNAPIAVPDLSGGDTAATVYYLPGTTGWGLALGGRPTALWRLQFQPGDSSFGVRTNQFGFNISWASGRVVVVEACTDLAQPIWSPVGTNTLTDGSSYFSDPQWTNHPARFYRLRSP